MKPIITPTVNPAIDASCLADEVAPVRKVRTRGERYDPGGGLNVARVVQELGGKAVAFYLAGGMTGQALERLVERSGITAVRVAGAATAMTADTGLCRREDVERLFAGLRAELPRASAVAS